MTAAGSITIGSEEGVWRGGAVAQGTRRPSNPGVSGSSGGGTPRAMWLYVIAIVLVGLAIAGSVFSGGIFTIVLVPVAAIIVICGLAYGAIARAAAEKSGRAGARNRLPRQPDPTPGHTLATPEQLADERRIRQ
jgi:hypothetical protein